MSSNKIIGVTLAAAAAVAFTVAPIVTFAGTTAKVQCMGTNACKGKGACKTAANACKGQNACKGKGIVMMSPKKCTAAKGTPAPAPAADAAAPAADATAPATTDAPAS